MLKPTTSIQLDGTGYVTFARRREKFSQSIDIILRFKTFAENGLLFLIGKGVSVQVDQLVSSIPLCILHLVVSHSDHN